MAETKNQSAGANTSYGTVSDPSTSPPPGPEKQGLASAPYPAQPQQPPPPYQQGQAPPVYYQEQQTAQVVVHQPLLSTTVPQTTREPTASIVAIIVGALSLTFLASFGCFWSLPCTIVAVILGIFSYEKGKAGDLRRAKKHVYYSICCSVCAWISVIIGAGVITGVVFAIIAATPDPDGIQ